MRRSPDSNPIAGSRQGANDLAGIIADSAVLRRIFASEDDPILQEVCGSRKSLGVADTLGTRRKIELGSGIKELAGSGAIMRSPTRSKVQRGTQTTHELGDGEDREISAIRM